LVDLGIDTIERAEVLPSCLKRSEALDHTVRGQRRPEPVRDRPRAEGGPLSFELVRGPLQ
jgi:hypothetical protein